ncbi:MAG: hypothetical protein E7352_01050 [Clostridiales bacterium]|nr:hypothetical protein [Clostridiales bacterium]MBE5746751.1 hypothetical protein [Clostridiales bacterium]
MIKIKDIYAGKPDAKDEIEVEGYEKFLDSYITPSCFDADNLINGTFCFISGYKGTGKTALLYYLQDYVSNIDQSTVTSFILFKGDYSDIERQEMLHLSKRLVSTISISNDIILEGEDFEIIWRWLFYIRIWEDNKNSNENLFLKDDKWKQFESIIKKINNIANKRKLVIPRIFKIGLTMTQADTSIRPEAEIDFSDPQATNTAAYRKLVKYIEELDAIFPTLQRTDIPYYIFVDELEAYYGEDKVFKRDLKLIRDLIFTIKKLNLVARNMVGGKIKIICSIRKEIINSINRFVVTKELNKTTSGFDVPLNWNYSNTNSFEHPILKILLKRILMAEKLPDTIENEKQIIKKWFPASIEDFDAASYILNNSWFKPRDIVRLILTAKTGLSGENTSFNANTFHLIRKEYSRESLNEIREEMRALYSENEIDTIFSCLTGFRKVFSLKNIEERIEKYFSQTFLKEKLQDILQDLYRLGVLGNYSRIGDLYRWQHKGDDKLILSDDWGITIHFALQSILSVNSKLDSGLNNYEQRIKVGNCYESIIINFNNNYIFVEFENNQKQYTGYINRRFSYMPDSKIKEGASLNAQIIGYDNTTKNWSMIIKN